MRLRDQRLLLFALRTLFGTTRLRQIRGWSEEISSRGGSKSLKKSCKGGGGSFVSKTYRKRSCFGELLLFYFCFCDFLCAFVMLL
jgi:hypothetical protein